MNYQIPQIWFCLFAFAIAAPYAPAQAAQTKSVSPVTATQEPKKPTTDEPAKADQERIYKGKEVDKKPVIKSKPRPDYPREAEDHQLGGTVVLRCIFASTGKITNIHVVVGLPYGFTESAIDAASRIKFKPAEKDGKPVSMWMELQYNFHPG
jgi:TonB family protein